MIEVTEAVRKAKEVFLALHEQDTVKEVRMAEAELGRDGANWQVTLSYFDDDVSGISKHKLLELDAETGTVRSVKVRTFSASTPEDQLSSRPTLPKAKALNLS